MSDTGDYITVARIGEIPPGKVKVFTLGKHRLAVCQVEGRFYAIDDRCTHDDGPLGEGTLKGEEVECPRHGARFNVKSGEAMCLPATVPVKTFVVRVQGDEVQVRI